MASSSETRTAMPPTPPRDAEPDEILDRVGSAIEHNIVEAMRRITTPRLTDSGIASSDDDYELPCYSPDAHAQLCQFRLLGLSPRRSAAAYGISEATLAAWIDDHPMLGIDLDRIHGLAVAFAAERLQAKMLEPGPVGLNAIKFFLATQTEEFRPRGTLAIAPTTGDAIGEIHAMYGLRDEEPPGVPAGAAPPPAGATPPPTLDAPESPPSAPAGDATQREALLELDL